LIDETSRADGSLSVIGELEAKLAKGHVATIQDLEMVGDSPVEALFREHGLIDVADLIKSRRLVFERRNTDSD
jgi:hypothetical protein